MELMLFTGFITFIVNVIVFVFSPYLLMISLIYLSILMCLMVSFYVSTFIAFITFLIYVGGIQVLFLYSLSVVPKEDYRNWKLIYRMLYLPLFIFHFLFFLSTPQSFHINNLWGFMGSESLLVHFMRLGSLFFLFVFIVFVLLLLMLVVCNLCNKSRFPLRQIQ